MTGRELANALLALPDPDAPVFFWNPGEWWQPQMPVQHEDQDEKTPYILVEKNLLDGQEVTNVLQTSKLERTP